MPGELGTHAIVSMLITLGAMLMYMVSKIRLEYTSAVALCGLIIAFELYPFRGDSPLQPAVKNVAREIAPSVTQEVAPEGIENVPGSDAPGEILLRGSDFLLGFGNEALITICLLLVLARGVERSGALRPLGRLLARIWQVNWQAAVLLTLVVSAFLSAFVNNTPVVIMMISVLLGIAPGVGLAPSKILLPAGLATILGGMCTTIGTSTNLLVASVSEHLGGPRFELLDFALPGSLAAAAGILYLWMIAPRLLPDRTSIAVHPERRVFDAAIRVGDLRHFGGGTLADLLRRIDGRIRIERIRRGRLEVARLPSLTLLEDDLLSVRGTPESLREFLSELGSTDGRDDTVGNSELVLAELVITPSSPYFANSMRKLRRFAPSGIAPVAVHRARGSARGDSSEDARLDTGDLVLVQGTRQDIDEMKHDAVSLVLDRPIEVARTTKTRLAVAIFLGVVLTAAFGITSIMVSALCGVVLMLACRCLTWDEAWRAIDTRLVLVIVTSLALGTALSATGATDYAARSLVAATDGLAPALVVASLLVVTALLTEVVTNNAVAVIATPFAIGLAEQLDQPPTAFVLAVLFGANMSFLTPIGYQTNLLILTAGGYRFSDFARIGLPLQILLLLVLGILLPLLYL